jgi:LAO/AO transport system kinase
VLTVSALTGRAIDDVWQVINDHQGRLAASGELAEKRREQQRDWLWAMIDDGLKRHFLDRPDVARLLPEIEAAVLEAKLTPTEGARRLLALLDEHGGGEAAPVSRRTRAS